MFKEFIEDLRRKQISVTFSGGKIKYTGPEQYINSQFIEDLKKYKGKLIKHLWPSECSNMMPINTDGNKVPFILLHGEKMNYPLSEYFGPEQPFYGFFHYGSEGEKIFHRTVEAFAADYITQLQKIVPDGPYNLAGFSFGGLIAFEMAVQLQRKGFDVPVLILIDCKNPAAKEPLNAPNIISRVYYTIHDFLREAYYWSYHKGRLIYYETFLSFKTKLHNEKRNYYIMGTYMMIGKKYKPKTAYKGEILLFRSSQHNSVHEYLGWDHLCDKIQIKLIEGTHKTLYESEESYNILSKNITDWLQPSNGQTG
jgi:thioesterase domain-containing protein